MKTPKGKKARLLLLQSIGEVSRMYFEVS